MFSGVIGTFICLSERRILLLGGAFEGLSIVLGLLSTSLNGRFRVGNIVHDLVVSSKYMSTGSGSTEINKM